MLACEYVRGSCSYRSSCWYLEFYQRAVTHSGALIGMFGVL